MPGIRPQLFRESPKSRKQLAMKQRRFIVIMVMIGGLLGGISGFLANYFTVN